MNLPQLLKATRQYFWNLSFEEVEVSYLNPSLPLEPNIYSFKTAWQHGQADFYLPTSPEMALKKHLAITQKDCFSIAHCFRDLEAEGPDHTKEFIMLEWYQVNQNYLSLMSSVEKYLQNFLKASAPFKIFTLPTSLPDNEPDFNQFFLNEVEPNLPLEPVFVVGYPAFLSPLAKPKSGETKAANGAQGSEVISRKEPSTGNAFVSHNHTSERFELYINRIEIANGCTENTDADSIKKSFESEYVYRQDNQLPSHPYSTDFINASSKLPPSAGVGLGLNRLLKLINTK
jgi:lysyl-tRNA synthetase class 2